jgi:hypothetical protein
VIVAFAAPQTFGIQRSFAVLSRLASWVFGLFSALCLAVPFLPDNGCPLHPNGLYVLAVIALFFGALAWLGHRIARQLPWAAVTVDDDGLWPAHLSKDTALLRWEDVRSTRERPYLQRLDLVDVTGRVRLKLEYQLVGFETLRALVTEKARLGLSPRLLPARFAKTRVYHLFTLVVLLCFLLLGLYVGRTNALLGYGLMPVVVALMVREYSTTVSGLVVEHDCLRIDYPLRHRVLRGDEVTAIGLGDVFVKGSRYPEVRISARSEKKTINLRGLGMDAVNLHQLLTTWKSGTLSRL